MDLARSLRFVALLAGIARVGPVLADPTAGDVMAKAWIPSAQSRHGETRILRRPDELCIQTILHTASFRKGIKEILAREGQVWSERNAGFEDSRRYTTELNRIKQVMLETPDMQPEPGQPYTLIMEFCFRPGDCRISFWSADVRPGEDTFDILSAHCLSRIVVSDIYMSRAQLIMATAACGHERSDLRDVLSAGGWLDLSPTVDASAVIPAH